MRQLSTKRIVRPVARKRTLELNESKPKTPDKRNSAMLFLTLILTLLGITWSLYQIWVE